VPRYLMFMMPALAVAGLGLVLAGAVSSRLGRREAGDGMRRYGVKAHLLGRALTAGAVALLFVSLPDHVKALVTGGGTATALAAGGLAFAALATALTLFAERRGSTPIAVAALAAMALELGSLVALRDQVRLELVADHFRLADVPTHEQWGMFVMFAAILVVGLAFLVVVTRAVAKNLIAKEIER